jgi:hypothetical protein
LKKNSEISMGVLQGLEERIALEEKNESRANFLNFMANSGEFTQGNSKDL